VNGDQAQQELAPHRVSLKMCCEDRWDDGAHRQRGPLSVPGAGLGVALAVGGPVAGIGVSCPGRGGDVAARRRGVGGAGLVPGARLGIGCQAVVGRLGGLGGVVLGREGPRWVLLGPRGRRGLLLLLPSLEARGGDVPSGRGLGGGRRVVLELLRLLLRLLLLLWLLRRRRRAGLRGTRLRGPGLGVVAC